MRFLSAIVAFVVAAAMIAFGIAQRTVLAPPDRLTTSAVAEGDAAFTVIDGSVLNSNAGQQRLVVNGAEQIFVAYGRTTDVMAWLGSESYNAVSFDPKAADLVAERVDPPAGAAAGDAPAGDSATGPSPLGSDLWLEERQSAGTLAWTVNVPDDVSVLIASDGTLPAPSEVRLSWPLSHSTPWAGPLIIGGGVLLLVGLFLYIWGLVHMRKTRGPRRKSGPKQRKLPQAPRPRAQRAAVLEPATTAKGRRSSRRSMIAAGGLTLVSGLLLSGCSSPELDTLLQGDEAPVPTSTVTGAPVEEVVPVAVTEGQLARIIGRVSTTVAKADKDSDTDLLKTRMTGPAYQERKANYKIRGKNDKFDPVDPIPATPIKLDLPEATDTWPRTVMAVVGGDDPQVAPLALVLVQDTPRDNYLVNYSMKLQANAPFPAVAPPEIGAAVLQNDVKLLSVQPDQVGAEYADILLKGKDSKFFDVFEAEPDGLRSQVGAEYKAKKKKDFPETASLKFGNDTGSGPILAFASNDSGAIVVTSIIEQETAKPTADGATVNLEGQAEALSGIKSTETGVRSTYGFQLMFYVPPSIDEGKVLLLGYAQALIGVKEL
ncbi:MAG: hypothetical protein JWR33_1849 [Naasia sp.]|uniref:hypothetical protein n=1 Tax=Naasia sp. TaxID=2546198 RepID=UPI00260252AE|nr:hypothetical protein [Naasia sp.]MCU1571108.1 hypothetical protein [Naasia sp.]